MAEKWGEQKETYRSDGGAYASFTMGPRKVTWFPHRHNPNGSWDSICSRCMATVATMDVEADLRLRETAHICSPNRLHPFGAKTLTSDG